MQKKRLFAIMLLATSVEGATLPFYDGFEPAELNFSNWSGILVDGTNTLLQSTEQAWTGTQSLKFIFAGVDLFQDAAAVLEFSPPVDSVFLRLWFFAPVGTEAAMGIGTNVRLVRFGDMLDGGTPIPQLPRLTSMLGTWR